LRVVVPALACALALAGCSSNSDDGASTSIDGSIPEFVFALTTGPASMDMTDGADVATAGIPALATEFLEAATLDGSFTPLLAEQTSEPDDTHIVYDLRQGVTFSDGSPLTVDDVVWSFEHAQRDGASNASQLVNIKKVSATGDMQVTVELAKPDPSVRFSAADTAVPIMQKAFGEAHSDDLGSSDALPIGTGPYVTTGFTPSSVTMERNPDYWGDAPAVERLEFTVIGSDSKAQLAVRSGEVQGTRMADLRTFSDWENVDGVTTYAAPQLQMDFYGFDTTKAPFDDVHFRRAVAYSIDRQGLLEAGFGGQADTLQAMAPLETVRAVAPSEEEADEFLDGLPQYDLDLDKAKAELAQSKYAGNVPPVAIQYVEEMPWSKLVALNLQENLKAIGVTSSVETYTYSDWLDAFYASAMLTPTPMFFSTNLDSSSIAYTVDLKGGYNFAKYTSPTTEQAVANLVGEQSWKSSKAILSDLADQVPYLPLFQEKGVFVLADGYTFTTPPSSLDFQTGAFISMLKAAG
jgi:peptide/nickel transport system substrate-binding protein